MCLYAAAVTGKTHNPYCYNADTLYLTLATLDRFLYLEQHPQFLQYLSLIRDDKLWDSQPTQYNHNFGKSTRAVNSLYLLLDTTYCCTRRRIEKTPCFVVSRLQSKHRKDVEVEIEYRVGVPLPTFREDSQIFSRRKQLILP